MTYLQEISMTDTSADDKNIAVLTHLGGIFFSVLPGLIVWLLKKDDSAFIGEQAREALNFQITVLIGYLIAGLLILVLVGILLWPVIYVANIILCIIAAVRTSKGEHYRYPLTLRLIN
jgi:uncharacterized protein